VDVPHPYRRLWAVDFEFTASPGERSAPLCLVARELRTGALVRHWLTDGAPAAPPFDTGPDSLFIAYYASAELGCFLVLDWPFPARILDLYAEFRCLTSGLAVPYGSGLLGALAYFGLDGLATAEKEGMRQSPSAAGSGGSRKSAAAMPLPAGAAGVRNGRPGGRRPRPSPNPTAGTVPCGSHLGHYRRRAGGSSVRERPWFDALLRETPEFSLSPLP
jgi:hypothetical protein